MLSGHGGNIYQLARELGCTPADINDMSSNVNPLGPMPEMAVFLREQLDRMTRLPEVDARGIVQGFAARQGIDPDHVLAANGTTWFIHTLPLALGTRKALIVGPTYADYADGCRMHAVTPEFLICDEGCGFHPDIESLTNQAGRFDTVFVCNPNNPTGALVDAADLARMCRENPQTVFVIDESYLSFVTDGERQSMIGCGLPNVMVLNSMSKIFRIPGLRIGFLVSGTTIIDKIKRYMLPWSVNSLAQTAVSWLLDHPEPVNAFVRQTREFIGTEMRRIAERAAAIPGLVAFPGCTDFLLFKLPAGLTSETVCDALAAERILVRNCANFKGLSNRFIRVSLKTADLNRQVVEKLGALCTSGEV